MNNLAVGPYGSDGQPGANAQWPGALVRKTIDAKSDNRAIVDVSTLSVSPDENYVVVTRANIGNPNACPNMITPQDIQSPWILAYSSSASTPSTVRTTVNGSSVCTWVCNSQLYYFNIDSLVRSIRNRFLDYLLFQKQQKEQDCANFINTMKATFEEQRTALTCALENSKSKYRNTQARQYIEQSQIQAAQASRNIKLGLKSDAVDPNINNPCGDYTPVSFQDPSLPLIDPDTIDN